MQNLRGTNSKGIKQFFNIYTLPTVSTSYYIYIYFYELSCGKLVIKTSEKIKRVIIYNSYVD